MKITLYSDKEELIITNESFNSNSFVSLIIDDESIDLDIDHLDAAIHAFKILRKNLHERDKLLTE